MEREREREKERERDRKRKDREGGCKYGRSKGTERNEHGDALGATVKGGDAKVKRVDRHYQH